MANRQYLICVFMQVIIQRLKPTADRTKPMRLRSPFQVPSPSIKSYHTTSDPANILNMRTPSESKTAKPTAKSSSAKEPNMTTQIDIATANPPAQIDIENASVHLIYYTINGETFNSVDRADHDQTIFIGRRGLVCCRFVRTREGA